MPAPLSSRAATRVFLATACAVVLIMVVLSVLTFGWPGSVAPVSAGCPTSGVPTVSIDGRNYHCEPVQLTAPPLQCPLEINQSWSGPSLALVFWDFTFHLARYSCGELSGIAIEIKEPNGNVTFGATQYGEPQIAVTHGMFTNDEEAGVMESPPYQNQNATIYVEIGV